MNCTHAETTGRYVEVEHPITGEVEREWEEQTQSLYEDIDVGRFRCTRCGEVGYYTGSWKKFFETGEPCPGSDLYRMVNGRLIRK